MRKLLTEEEVGSVEGVDLDSEAEAEEEAKKEAATEVEEENDFRIAS